MTVLFLLGTGLPQGNFLLYETVRRRFRDLYRVVIFGTPESEDANGRLRRAISKTRKIQVDPIWGALRPEGGRPGYDSLRPDDLRHNYLYATEAFHRIGPDIEGQHIVLGYLGGTKAMAFGVMLAAEDALERELSSITVVTLDPRSGRSDLVDLDPEGGLDATPKPPKLPPSRSLPFLMELAGVVAPPFQKLDPRHLTKQATDIAWSVWRDRPWTASRLLYRGMPWAEGSVSDRDYVRALFTGCDGPSLEACVGREVVEENHKLGGAVIDGAPGDFDWEGVAQGALGELAPLAASTDRSKSTRALLRKSPTHELAVDSFWKTAKAAGWALPKVVARRAVRAWLEQGAGELDGVPWGRVFLDRSRAALVNGDGPCTTLLPGGLPYAVPTERVRVCSDPDLVTLSRDGGSELVAELSQVLDVFGLGGQPRPGLVYEAAVGVALCDAVKDLNIDVYTSSKQVRGIELDFILVGPANRVLLIEAKADAGYADGCMAGVIKAEQEQRIRDAAAQGLPLPGRRKKASGNVKPQQHNAQLEVAATLSGDREARVAYALPGHCSEGSRARVAALPRAIVLPVWDGKKALVDAIKKALSMS